MIKKILAAPLIIFLTFVLIKPYLQAGFPYTHDGENHLARFANYKVAVKEGQIPPRFAPNLMNHYGYPVFNYNYPLANIISLPFSFLKINYETTFKILASGFIFIGLWGIYHWLEKLESSLGGRMLGVTLYALSPFLWSTILFRGNIGEIMALGLFPWLLWLIEKSKIKDLKIFDVILIAAFLISHNIAVLFGLPLLVIYSLFRVGKERRVYRKLGLVLGGAIALTLWFWLPAVAEKNLVTVGEVSLVNNFDKHFPTFRQLFFSPLKFGFSYLGKIDSFSFGIGLAQTLVFIISSIFTLKLIIQKRRLHKTFILVLIASFLLILFQLKETAFLWRIIPLASFIQFPWRLGLFLSVSLAGLGALLWKYLNKKTKLLIWVAIFIQLINFVKARPADYFHKNNVDYDAFSQSTTSLNENTTQGFTYIDIGDWQPTAKIIQGQGDVGIDVWTGSKRQYRLSIQETAIVVEPTMNFAGWQTLVLGGENQREKIEYLNNNLIQGRIGYQLEPGEYQIKSSFTQKTWPRFIGNTISGITILAILLLFLKRKLSYQLNFYLGWSILLFFIGWSAHQFLIYKPSFPYAYSLLANSGLPQWLYSWANFDGVHYLTIVEKGYMGTGLIQAFFPLFPLIVQSINNFFSSPILVGLVLNTFLGFFLLKAWKKIIDLELGVEVNKFGIHVLFLFPTAFFFNAFYTESLFLWLVLTSFIFARQKKWWVAGIMAALASATRVVGIMLIPALLFELWLQNPDKIKGFILLNKKKIIAILFGALGMASYMFYLYKNFNDPLYFFHVQAEFGGGRQESLVSYPQVVWRYLKILWTYRPFDLKYFAFVQEFLIGILGLIGLIWSWFKIRKSYVVFSILVFLIPTLTGTFSSMPRYFLASFSIFLLIAKIFKGKKIPQFIWISVSTLLLIFNTILFIQGYWVA